MPLTIATWNINSVRLRMPAVLRFLREYEPDILCLQEIKCADGNFPLAPLVDAGYPHIEIHGQKAYHGVAVASRRRLSNPVRLKFCGRDDARHIAVDVKYGAKTITIHNFYVPAGGDVPDPKRNEKFAHKLKFLDEMVDLGRDRVDGNAVLVGDLNIAPLETDVWSHKQLLKVVSHTPIETQALTRVQTAAPWVDIVRRKVPPEEKLFTWWSYRSPDWKKNDRGRRLDHIWTTGDLAERVRRLEVPRPVRDWEKPSDHIPVIAEFR